MDESSREFTRDWVRKFWVHDGSREAVEGRARGRGGRVRVGLVAFLRRMEGVDRCERMYEGWLIFV